MGGRNTVQMEGKMFYNAGKDERQELNGKHCRHSLTNTCGEMVEAANAASARINSTKN